MSKPKINRGRPSLYRAEFVEQARKYCLLGATDEEMAGFFGVALSTFSNWKVNHPEFMEALKAGKAVADANVADRLYRRAMGYSHEAVKIFNCDGAPLKVPYTEHYPPDTTACIFWLKNRQREKWRDRTDQSVSHAYESMSDEDIRAELAALLAGGVLAPGGDAS